MTNFKIFIKIIDKKRLFRLEKSPMIGQNIDNNFVI